MNECYGLHFLKYGIVHIFILAQSKNLAVLCGTDYLLHDSFIAGYTVVKINHTIMVV